MATKESSGARSESGQARATGRRRQERKHRVLSHGAPSLVPSIADAVVIKDVDLFFLSQPDGDVPVDGRHGFGLYYHDCRYLNGFELRIGQKSGLNPLAVAIGRGDEAVLELTNPDLRMPSGQLVPKESIGLRWTRRVDGRSLTLENELLFTNYGSVDAEFPISLTFASRFEDIFAVRGLWKERLGRELPAIWRDHELTFRYEGADGLDRRVMIGFDPQPEDRGERLATFQVRLPIGGQATIRCWCKIREQAATERRSRGAPVERQAWLSNESLVRSDSLVLEDTIERSFDDLRTLLSEDSGEAYFAAGVPWFATLFGRGSLITAFQVLAYDPDVAAHTLRLLAARQGTETDDWRDEEPGKILHELRVGEYARTGLIPHEPYYGSVDSTPLFLLLVARHATWTGDLTLFRELRGHVEAALGWVRACGERNRDGFLAYDSPSAKGLANQGWKDSGDAIVTAEGSLAQPPIAVVEVQGYAEAAQRELADLFEREGDASRASELRSAAERLRDAIERRFWLGDDGGYALALQHGGEPCAVITSNPGHLLWTGTTLPDRARRTVELLMGDGSYSGWGVRTFASSQRRYNPIGYHLGTVWPHDNSILAAGFRRYGFEREALRLLTAHLEAALHFPEARLPEVFAGFARSDYGVPVRYPVACHPQAWAAGSIPYMLQTVLGLQADGFARCLRVTRPRLPSFVGRVEIHNLRFAGGSVSLAFTREGSRVRVETLATEGDVDVDIEEVRTPTGRRRRRRGRTGSPRAPPGGRVASDGLGYDRRVTLAPAPCSLVKPWRQSPRGSSAPRPIARSPRDDA